jgi:hypothetical protein
MERKNTLFVFALSSILVLAGFAASEKAYAQVVPQIGLGDFYCWDTLNPIPPSFHALINTIRDGFIHQDLVVLQ